MLRKYFNTFVCALAMAAMFGGAQVEAQFDPSASCDVIDVGLVFDSSENMGEENFENLRSFLTPFLSVLSIGMKSTRIAAIQVASEPSTLWYLSESFNSSSLVQRINEMEYFGGQQHLSTAFHHLLTDTFSSQNGDRSGVPDAVVIFTGGEASQNKDGLNELKMSGVHVFVVTVGNDADLKWKQFASPPQEDNFFNLDSAFHVALRLQNSAFALCADEIEEPTTTSPVTSSSLSSTTEEFVPTLPTRIPEELPVESTTDEAIPLFPTDIPTTSSYSGQSSPYCPTNEWTSWYNNDDPQGEGDDESLITLRSRFPGEICENPTEFEARVASSGVALDFNSGNVLASRLEGLECLNIFGDCEDYEIRFCCPQAVTTPPPSITESYFHIFPQTTPQVTKTAATTDEELVFTKPTPQTEDSTPIYKPTPQCAPGGWTPWLNNDDPRGDGDDETLETLRARFPSAICADPVEFEARVVSSGAALDSSASNVFANRLYGLECFGEDCEDYEIRFCCPRALRCLLGSTSYGSEREGNLVEAECPTGELCSDVTTTVVGLTTEGENTTRVDSFGLCMSPSKCSKFQCDSAWSLVSSDVIDVTSCEVTCCEEDLCNLPRHSQPSSSRETIDESYDQGTRCYKGIEVEGISDAASIGLTNLGLRLVHCDLGQVCSDTMARVALPGGPVQGAVIRQSRCLVPVACEPANCKFMKSILPEHSGVELINCSSSCCDWNGCNAPLSLSSSLLPVLTTTTESSTTEKALQEKPPTARAFESPKATTTPFVPKQDVDFLPACTAREAVNAIFWCESLFAFPQPYEGLETCRNKLQQAARCVQKQLSWCLSGNKMNKLDSFNFPSFNSEAILSFLQEASLSDSSALDEQLNSFCFHSGYNYQFRKPVTTQLSGCHNTFLTELREKAKTFYYAYTWARQKEDICKAHNTFKQWFLESTSKQCTFDNLVEEGYSVMAEQYLKNLVGIALREFKAHESLSCLNLFINFF